MGSFYGYYDDQQAEWKCMQPKRDTGRKKKKEKKLFEELNIDDEQNGKLVLKEDILFFRLLPMSIRSIEIAWNCFWIRFLDNLTYC